MKKRLIEDINRINQLLGLNEMRFDGKSTGLFSDEENTMNELEIDEGHCSSKNLDEEDKEDENMVSGAELLLPRGKEVILQAEEEDYKRGLLVKLLKDGGYRVKYWYGDDVKVYPAEVEVDGESIKKDAEVVDILFHPELKKDKDLNEGHCSSKGLDEDELKYDPEKVVHNDEDHIVVDRDMEDGEFTYEEDDVSYMDDEWLVIDKDDDEEISMARKNRVLRRPYSSSAQFKAGLSEQERPPLALDRELTFVLDEIHDDLFYTLPGQFQEYNLGEQVRLYQELKSRLDSYPASKSLPEVKQILDRMEYDLSGLEGFNERLGELFYILTGRYEFSPEARRNS